MKMERKYDFWYVASIIILATIATINSCITVRYNNGSKLQELEKRVKENTAIVIKNREEILKNRSEILNRNK